MHMRRGDCLQGEKKEEPLRIKKDVLKNGQVIRTIGRKSFLVCLYVCCFVCLFVCLFVSQVLSE